MELGATWLHGLKGNPLYAYAVEAGIMSPKAKQRGARCRTALFMMTADGSASCKTEVPMHAPLDIVDMLHCVHMVAKTMSLLSR